ncbi:hypothetical protein B5P44_03500 [Mycobacterium sp. CBMA 213]|nr:hypothetical protein [Mycolicibacterium sp. CBMA 213]
MPLLFNSDSQPGFPLFVAFMVIRTAGPGTFRARQTAHHRLRRYADGKPLACAVSHPGSGPDFLSGINFDGVDCVTRLGCLDAGER